MQKTLIFVILSMLISNNGFGFFGDKKKTLNCEFIEGEDEYDIGRNLAITLRDKNLI